MRLEWTWRLLLLAAAAALVAVALAYSPARHAGFVWDDHALAEADAPFRHVSLAKLMTGTFWPDGSLADARAPYYRPLVLLSLRLDVARGGTSADFHTTNIALHLLGCLLLGLTAIRLGASRQAAILAALLWGLAPRLSESVVWISGRTDLLAGTLGLAALAVSPDVSAAPAEHPRFPWARSIFAGLLLFAALCSKEVAVAFVAAIVAAAAGRSAPRASRIRVATTVSVPVAAWLALRSVALATQHAPLRDLGFGRRVETVFEALARYAEMTLDALHPRTSIGMLGEPDMARAVAGGALAVLLVALAIRHRRAGQRLRVGTRVALALGATSLGLVVHVVPFTLAGSVTADRLLYVPLAALALGLSSLGTALPRRPRSSALLGAAALTVAVLFAATTKARAAEYEDETEFWIIAAEQAHPHNTMPTSALAAVVRDAGEVELACRLFERASRVLASSERAGLVAHRRARENLSNCWARSGRYDEALALAEELAAEYPDSGRIQMALGFARLQVRRFEAAERAFGEAVRLDPSLAPTVAFATAQTRRAAVEWERFRSDRERTADPLGWANHLARVGRAAEADAAFAAVAATAQDSESARQSALSYLAAEGDAFVAERALGNTAPADLAAILAARAHRRRDIARWRSRIERLGN